MPSVLSKLHIPFPSKKKTSAPTAKEINEIRKLQLQKKLHCALEERRLERTGANVVSREEYDLATGRISKALEKYSKITSIALPSIPHSPVIVDMAIVKQWSMQGQTADDKSSRHKQLDCFTQRLKEVFPTWKSKNTSKMYHGAPPPLHRDAMHSIMAMLEPVEIASCMLVCKNWYKDGKSASWCWKNGTVKIYQDAENGIASETYTTPWVAIAIRRASRIVVDSCHKPVMMYGQFLNLKGYAKPRPDSRPYIALHDELAQKGSGLKNLRELVVGKYWGRATELLEKMFGHKSLERITVKNPDIDFITRMQIIETCPNLQHADIPWYDDCMTYLKVERVCSAIAGLRSTVVHVNSEASYQDVRLNHFATVLLPNLLAGLHVERMQLEELELRIRGCGDVLDVVNILLMRYSGNTTASKLRKLKIVQKCTYSSCFGTMSVYWCNEAFHIALGKAMAKLQHTVLNAVNAKNQLEQIDIHLYEVMPARHGTITTAFSTLFESLPAEARKRAAELFTFKIENKR
jgi:hypothetical protein